MQKSIIISLLISTSFVGGIIYLVSKAPAPVNENVSESQNIEMRDGVQYVTVNAKGGYFPRSSEIQGEVPTKLIIRTDNTYDCSAALVIRSVGFQKILKPTGEEIIDLGTPKSGEKIQGVCGMGMYSFQINVS